MIDQIAVQMAGGFNLITARAWQDLPVAERTLLIRAGRVEFLADGESVPTREALTMLKAAFAPALAV